MGISLTSLLTYKYFLYPFDTCVICHTSLFLKEKEMVISCGSNKKHWNQFNTIHINYQLNLYKIQVIFLNKFTKKFYKTQFCIYLSKTIIICFFCSATQFFSYFILIYYFRKWVNAIHIYYIASFFL